MTEVQHDAGEVLKLSRGRDVTAWTFVFEHSGDGLILLVRARRERLFFLSSAQVAQMAEQILVGATQRGWTAVEYGPDVPTPPGPHDFGQNVEGVIGHTIVATDRFMAIGLALPEGRYRAARWAPPLSLGLAYEMRRALGRGDLRDVGTMPAASGTPQ